MSKIELTQAGIDIVESVAFEALKVAEKKVKYGKMG